MSNIKDIDLELDVDFEISTSIHKFTDPSEDGTEYKLKINLYDGIETKIIGYAKIVRFLCSDATDLFMALDGYSINTLDIAENVLKSNKSGFQYINKDFDDYVDFIVINEVGIEKEFRGKGIIRELFEALNNFFNEECVYLLYASPMKYTNGIFEKLDTHTDADTKKVIDSYKKSGFKQIKRNSNCMYKISR